MRNRAPKGHEHSRGTGDLLVSGPVFRAQRPGIPESSSHFRAEGAVFPIAQPEVPSALVAFSGRPFGVSDRPAELSGQATSLFGRADLRRRRRLASTIILRFRPSTMSRDVGVAEPLVDRTDSDPRHITHATLRFAVAAI